jgi:uncharacterized membrane protein
VFKALIDDAKSAASSFVDTFLAKASVAVPFVIALGFATVAAALTLIESFGTKTAFWILAAGFCAIGLLAAMVVTLRQQGAAAAAEQESRESGLGDIGDLASAAATQTAGQLPLSLIASFLANPSAPTFAAARLVARNRPLLLLLALIALLFWPTEEPERSTADEEEGAPGERPESAPQKDPWREAA